MVPRGSSTRVLLVDDVFLARESLGLLFRLDECAASTAARLDQVGDAAALEAVLLAQLRELDCLQHPVQAEA